MINPKPFWGCEISKRNLYDKKILFPRDKIYAGEDQCDTGEMEPEHLFPVSYPPQHGHYGYQVGDR